MKNWIYLLLLFLAFSASAQQKVVISIDTVKRKIGAEFKLTLKADVDTASKVVFPKMKNFGALEVIRSYPVDTVKKDARYELVKMYGLTKFDTGKFTIPRLPVLIDKKQIFSDSIRVEVADVAVDTLKQKMYDIKDIIPAKDDYSNWWIYLLIIAVLAVIGFLSYRYFKNRPAAKEEQIVYKTPIEKATTLLKTLEKKELVQRGEVKAYYSELTDIARNYIEEAIHIPAMESTTSELIEALQATTVKRKMALSTETVSNLERVLRQADLVKFAKSKPLDFEIADDRSKIERSIVTLDKSIPQEVEEETDAEDYLREKERLKVEQQRKKRRKIIIASAAVLISAIGLMYAFDGFNLFGSRTKSLLKGEWIYSEYGDPGMRVETPEVLVRQDASKVIPKGAMAFLKDMKIFSAGSESGEFYTMLSTAKFAAETELDLDKAVDGVTQTLELRGFQNILVKQEKFQTRQGIEGLRAFGTMSYVDRKLSQSRKFYYEILLFKQAGGLQQIIVMHEEGDKAGQEILTRIINSVELKTTES